MARPPKNHKKRVLAMILIHLNMLQQMGAILFSMYALAILARQEESEDDSHDEWDNESLGSDEETKSDAESPIPTEGEALKESNGKKYQSRMEVIKSLLDKFQGFLKQLEETNIQLSAITSGLKIEANDANRRREAIKELLSMKDLELDGCL